MQKKSFFTWKKRIMGHFYNPHDKHMLYSLIIFVSCLYSMFYKSHPSWNLTFWGNRDGRELRGVFQRGEAKM